MRQDALTVVRARNQAPLRIESYQTWNADGNEPSALFYRVDDGYLVRFPAVADFEIATGGGVLCTPVPDAGERWRPIYQQQIVPLLESLKGVPVYHGAAVATASGAIALLGPSGTGKSTLTAALASRGHAFLSDDCLSLREDRGQLCVVPHLPEIRLWNDSLDAIAPADAAGGQAPGSPKPHLEAGPSLPHCDRPLPLRRVYVLAEGDDLAAPRIEVLAPAALALAWMTNAFVLDIKSPEVLRRNLEMAARLARTVPGARLAYPRRYDALDAVVAAILADAMAPPAP